MPLQEEHLDNPAWWAMQSHHARFTLASANGTALRYRPDISVFAAVESVDDAAWGALHEVAGPGGVVGLFLVEVGAVPSDWTEVFRGQIVQMVGPDVGSEAPPHPDLTELEEADAADMFALAQSARPGPFEIRTHDLGRFVGVRRDGRLIAMAGERFRLDGATEISAVCTAEDQRGRGWGALLTLEMVRSIRARGDVPFLHVETSNRGAVDLYRRLGFSARREGTVVAAIRRD